MKTKIKKRKRISKFFRRFGCEALFSLPLVGVILWQIISIMISLINNDYEQINIKIMGLIVFVLSLVWYFSVVVKNYISFLRYDIRFDTEYIFCKQNAKYEDSKFMCKNQVAYIDIKKVDIKYRGLLRNDSSGSTFGMPTVIYLTVYGVHNKKHEFYISDFTNEYLLQVLERLKQEMKNKNNIKWESIDEKALVDKFDYIKTNFKKMVKKNSISSNSLF